jgi:hypothetical protein
MHSCLTLQHVGGFKVLLPLLSKNQKHVTRLEETSTSRGHHEKDHGRKYVRDPGSINVPSRQVVDYYIIFWLVILLLVIAGVFLITWLLSFPSLVIGTLHNSVSCPNYC